MLIWLLVSLAMAVPPADNCGSAPENFFPPQWPNRFTASWHMWSGSERVAGYTKYDWTNGRMEWGFDSVHADPFCRDAISAHAGEETPCRHVVIGGVRYIEYTGLQTSCSCCDSSKWCGMPPPDYMQNATFTGTDYINGVSVNVWQLRDFTYRETQGDTPTSRKWVSAQSTSSTNFPGYSYYYNFVWDFTPATPTITWPVGIGGSCDGTCKARQTSTATFTWPNQILFG